MIIPGITAKSEPEQRHEWGLWTFENERVFYPACSACGGWHIGRPTNYCPNCGALMYNQYDADKQYEKVLREVSENVGF